VNYKQIEATRPRSWVLVFGVGDDPVPELERFARDHGLRGAHFTGIGAFSDAVVAFFEWSSRTYRDIPVREQVEVLSLAGDVAEGDGGWVVHAHAVLGRADGAAVGGHLRAAHVRPTLEVVLEETPVHLVRVHDPESGLALIDLRRSAPG
jgi:predicted DNA-binding protein with PD1-like motif